MEKTAFVIVLKGGYLYTINGINVRVSFSLSGAKIFENLDSKLYQGFILKLNSRNIDYSVCEINLGNEIAYSKKR